MSATRLILVGGFLGAGKTTLMAQAAQRLARRGKRIGLITNDQAPNLVDTAALAEAGFPVQEVSGGCFCCRFADLLSAGQRLIEENRPDVLIGEPVGSCTDLAATVIRPMQQLHGERFRVAPFSVLVDPGRALDSLPQGARSRFAQHVIYIFRKQLEEADLLVLNKVDALAPGELEQFQGLLAEHWPQKPVRPMSALSGQGVDAWLDLVMQDGPAGRRLAEVDYDTYAEGEAALGWLNAAVHLRAAGPCDWRRFALALLVCVQGELRAGRGDCAREAPLDRRPGEPGGQSHQQRRHAGRAQARSPPRRRGPAAAQCAGRSSIRGVCAVLDHCLPAAGGDGVELVIDDLRSFAPSRPEPTYRFA